jgi:hypothetical protein
LEPTAQLCDTLHTNKGWLPTGSTDHKPFLEKGLGLFRDGIGRAIEAISADARLD